MPNAALPDSRLENALRSVVRECYKNKDLESLTVRRVRKAVEEELDLSEDFFKNDERWKEKSKSVIQAEVNAHDDARTSSQSQPPSPAAAKQKKVLATKVTKAVPKQKNQGTKRASTESAEPKPKKRRKTSTSDAGNSLSEEEQAVTKRPKAEAKRDPTLSPEPGTEEETEIQQSRPNADPGAGRVEGSESEMSVVLDEDPKPKKQKRRKSDLKPKAKKIEATKTKRPSEGPIDPEAEEIKRLQGWLIKCGIRKMWYKELAPYDTAKAKIKHLKEMLTDAGMTGRYSKEKADQIREERELKADLEAVQQGEKAWGKAEEDDKQGNTGGGGRSRRTLARGFQGLDFLNDDDGEETD